MLAIILCVSVRSTVGLWASGRRCRELSVAAAASRLQKEAETACADSMGSAVLGWSVTMRQQDGPPERISSAKGLDVHGVVPVGQLDGDTS